LHRTRNRCCRRNGCVSYGVGVKQARGHAERHLLRGAHFPPLGYSIGMTTIAVTLTPELADKLSTVKTKCFFEEQSGRFDHAEMIDTPFEADFAQGTMFWCDTVSDALLLLMYERAEGFQALLLRDLATRVYTYVVMSSRAYGATRARHR